MRLPFLQVDADFLATGARDLAELLATSEAEAGWAMVRLWGWAVSKAATPEALGLLDGPDMQRLAERAAGWAGEQGAFLGALLHPAMALATREDGGAVRLAGMERYAATFRKLEADRARKASGGRRDVARKSTGIPPEVARKTQTQTQTQKKEGTALSAGADSPEAEEDLPDATADAREVQPELELAGFVPPPRPRTRKPPTGPAADLKRALAAVWQEVRRYEYKSPSEPADAKAVKWLLDTGESEAELCRRWRNLLRWSAGGYPTVGRLAALQQHYSAAEVVTGAIRAGGRGVMPVSDFDAPFPPSRAEEPQESYPPFDPEAA